MILRNWQSFWQSLKREMSTKFDMFVDVENAAIPTIWKSELMSKINSIKEYTFISKK